MIFDDFMMARATISNRLKTEFETNPIVPFNDESVYPRKKGKRPMRDVAIVQNPIIVMPDMEYFEIGNEEAETTTPQYHILEDAQTIRNPYMGTKQSKGSQRRKAPSRRDYGKFVYLRPVKGSISVGQEYRTQFNKRDYQFATNKIVRRDYIYKSRRRSFRYNRHWAWIERLLRQVVPNIAVQLGAKLVTGQEVDWQYERPVAELTDLIYESEVPEYEELDGEMTMISPLEME